ncbi:MAG: MBL fold metallo-hydrolase [bacterium]
MRKIYLMIFVGLFALSASFAVVQQDASKIEIVATKVAGNVYMIHGRDDSKAFSGGNIGVSVGDDGVVMVDSKMAPLGDKIKTAIKELGGDSPKYILNTHVHGDHTSGNIGFSKDGTIIAHTNVRKRIMGDQPEDAWPVLTFEQSVSIHFNGEEIKALHFPRGHTDGDAVVYFTGSNVVHMGDHYFSGLLPFVDLDSGGSVQGYMANVKKVLDELPDDVKIIPGHGPLATKDDLQTNYRMLQETTSLVTQKMKEGRSLDEIKTDGLQEEWKSWSWSFISTERWIATIYKSYSEEMTQK